MEGLEAELKGIIGRKRRFLLLCISDIDQETARKLCKIPRGTYESWMGNTNSQFVRIYKRRADLTSSYKLEAIRLLRRDNQRNAVLLEDKIMHKLLEEIETGDYVLLRTNLARDVYTRLMTDIESSPQLTDGGWITRLQQINVNVEANNAQNNQTNNYLEDKYPQGNTIQISPIEDGQLIQEASQEDIALPEADEDNLVSPSIPDPVDVKELSEEDNDTDSN